MYDVVVTNSIDGTVVLSEGFEVILFTGIFFNSDEIKLSVYPNPSSDYVKVISRLADNSKVTISLVDMNGRVINTISKDNVQILSETIDIESLPSGVYNLLVNVDNKIYTKRIIKK